MNSTENTVEPSSSGWRFRLGMAIVGFVILSWLLVPFAAAVGAAGTTIAAISGILFVGNKVLLILVVAIMGKPGFLELKRRLFSYLIIVTPRFADEVGPIRHRIGVTMFCLPLITAFLEPYVDFLWPGLQPKLWQLQLFGDFMFVSSVVVLGGNFWGKVRALFVRGARDTESSEG